MSKRPSFKKSIVWDYFSKDAQGNNVICSLCKKTFKFYKNTSNMKDHLRRIHPIEFKGDEDEQNETSDLPIISAASNTNIETTSKFEITLEKNHGVPPPPIPSVPPQKKKRQLRLTSVRIAQELAEKEILELDKHLVYMIIKDYQPLSIVEDVGFRSLVNKLNPQYNLPSRKSITEKLIPQYYKSENDKLIMHLKNVQFVSITSDYWQSDSTKSYLTITAHYIDNFKLYSTVLSTEEVTVTHSAANTGEVMSTILNKFNISNKIVTVVTDNAANMKKAVCEELKTYQHSCVAHTLNLTVNEALRIDPLLTCLLNKCRSIVSHFKHSARSSHKLKEQQLEMNIPQLKLKQDVTTRWNSTYIMIERIVSLKLPLCVVMANLSSSSPENLSGNEWATLEECISLLEPFMDLTEVLSGEYYVTMSMVIPLIRGLQYILKDSSPVTQIGRQLKSSLFNSVEQRLSPLKKNIMAACATFLDPRFKKTGFGLEENAEQTQEWIKKELTELIICRSETNSDKQNTPNTQNSGAPKINVKEHKSKIWLHFDEKAVKHTAKVTPIVSASSLLAQYIEMPLVERHSDPLEFWKSHQNLFPDLMILVQKYLCIPSTSVPSERVFSKAGYITNKRRNRLAPKALNEIIFLNGNMSIN